MAIDIQHEQTVPDDVIPRGSLPPLKYRDLPEPLPFRKLIGPGIILAGLSLGSGEFVLWPYITYESQFVFFWACLLGVATQFFLNMEIARWTLATGETAVAGFIRLGKPWAVVFLLANLIPYVIPAWANGAARVLSWLIHTPQLAEGDKGQTILADEASQYVVAFTIGSLFFCGLVLTAGPVVYKTVERIQMLLVGFIISLVLILAVLVVRMDDISSQISATVTFGNFQFVPDSPDLTAITLLGALAFAGAGGTLNLGQSNYLRDKGFAMGAHIGRITSPITGQEEAIADVGYHFPHTDENMRRWRQWWRLANREHFLSFFLTCLFCLVVLTLICHALFYDGTSLRPDAQQFTGSDRFAFIYGESLQLSSDVGQYAKIAFLVMGFAILLTTELGVLDVVARVATDVVRVAWLRESSFWSESRLYYAFLWGEILMATGVTVLGEELVKQHTFGLFETAAAVNGAIMCIYSGTLLWLNNRYLPPPLRMSKFRLATSIWAFCFFGFFAVWAGIHLFGGN